MQRLYSRDRHVRRPSGFGTELASWWALRQASDRVEFVGWGAAPAGEAPRGHRPRRLRVRQPICCPTLGLD